MPVEFDITRSCGEDRRVGPLEHPRHLVHRGRFQIEDRGLRTDEPYAVRLFRITNEADDVVAPPAARAGFLALR